MPQHPQNTSTAAGRWVQMAVRSAELQLCALRSPRYHPGAGVWTFDQVGRREANGLTHTSPGWYDLTPSASPVPFNGNCPNSRPRCHAELELRAPDETFGMRRRIGAETDLASGAACLESPR